MMIGYAIVIYIFPVKTRALNLTSLTTRDIVISVVFCWNACDAAVLHHARPSARPGYISPR
jgi:hypothetical protein